MVFDTVSFLSFLDWKEILSKTSVHAGDQMFKDTCKTCFSMKQKNRPAILGTSLISLEPEPSIRLYMARGKYKYNELDPYDFLKGCPNYSRVIMKQLEIIKNLNLFFSFTKGQCLVRRK